MNLYVDAATYGVLVLSAAADMPPCKWSGGLDVDGAAIKLGEQFAIWPQSILADARAHGHE